MRNKRSSYISVNIPESLIREVDELIGSYGYISRSEFIKDAIRERIITIKSLKREKGDR